ncbi:hypothetical protein Nepgr_013474 [Nepenthes gracilis]|uniref:Uncharacterized protein n=1 Tax=Nepenthes gracilis TaxID=150966 RepID=A0AAD3SHW9_NEPGR|nr:hypothetical protein Nepgr_013474 [Nepenthes gracilis]
MTTGLFSCAVYGMAAVLFFSHHGAKAVRLAIQLMGSLPHWWLKPNCFCRLYVLAEVVLVAYFEIGFNSLFVGLQQMLLFDDSRWVDVALIAVGVWILNCWWSVLNFADEQQLLKLAVL